VCFVRWAPPYTRLTVFNLLIVSASQASVPFGQVGLLETLIGFWASAVGGFEIVPQFPTRILTSHERRDLEEQKDVLGKASRIGRTLRRASNEPDREPSSPSRKVYVWLPILRIPQALLPTALQDGSRNRDNMQSRPSSIY